MSVAPVAQCVARFRSPGSECTYDETEFVAPMLERGHRETITGRRRLNEGSTAELSVEKEVNYLSRYPLPARMLGTSGAALTARFILRG